MSEYKKAKKNAKRTKVNGQSYKAGVFAGADSVKDIVCEALNSESPVSAIVSMLKLELNEDNKFIYRTNEGVNNTINLGVKDEKDMQYFEVKTQEHPQLTIEDPEFKRITNTEALDPSRNSFGVKGRRFKKGQKVNLTHLYTGQDMGQAEVFELKNGIPWKIKFSDGRIEHVIGLIIQVIPLLKELWDTVKSWFKKKDK